MFLTLHVLEYGPFYIQEDLTYEKFLVKILSQKALTSRQQDYQNGQCSLSPSEATLEREDVKKN